MEATQQLLEQLRAENSTLRDHLSSSEAQRSQVQAELNALTDASHVLREDRDQLQSKVDELQATVNRLTDMVWGAAARSDGTPKVNRHSSPYNCR